MDNGVGITNSDYLSLIGYRLTTATTVEEAYGVTDGVAADGCHFNVALMLDRVEDPTAMLQGDWASRQTALQDSALWSKYGADPATYQTVLDQLAAVGLTVIDANTPGNDGYYTGTVENRTIWVQLTTPAEFNTLFGTTANPQTLQYSANAGDLHYWNGELTLPPEWGVVGLWFDAGRPPVPVQNLTGDPAVILDDGAQSPGNSAIEVAVAPQDVATLYNFPLNGQEVNTGAIGLIEPGIGTYMSNTDPTGTGFQLALDTYLQGLGLTGTGQVSVQGVLGQSEASGERSLDVGIVAAINPNSDLQFFNGSGTSFLNASATVFTAIQASIWNPASGLPAVTSNSYGDTVHPYPGSPFWTAYQQLAIDAALMNQTSVAAAGDGGSSGETPNGLTNVSSTTSQPYNLLVGGTSVSSQSDAMIDDTLVGAATSAIGGSQAILWSLITTGLKTMPTSTSDIGKLMETVWNTYTADNDDQTIHNYTSNSAGSGGVDVTQLAPPWYQAAFGLNPVTSDSTALPGRGVPDVSAAAGGNMHYTVPEADMIGTYGDGGTSAAAPLWASLITQFNYIFNDQGLPNLGFMNDLLYLAEAIAPGSFNDVLVGRNNSAFYYGNGYYSIDGTQGSATNIGYSAGAGYDYASGLGTPNGLLLGRALTAIAHAQTSFPGQAAVLDSDGSGGWTSGADQALLFQTVASGQVSIGVDIDGSDTGFSSGATQSYAWTARLAQQVLQSDFDPNLVRLFDKAGQGAITDAQVSDGDSLSVSFNGTTGGTYQADLTSDYGFVEFRRDGDSAVTVARAVAIADTAGAADNQLAVVRVRQNGQDNVAVTFYQVDDFAGTIDGLRPGQAGYAAAAQANAYQFFSGGTAMSGPGYGNYGQNLLMGVDAGDYIAMSLTNNSSGQTYWAFSQANSDGQGHLWSYGLNTWGWEDTRGGDHDFNDIIVQLDFTSASGSNLLV